MSDHPSGRGTDHTTAALRRMTLASTLRALRGGEPLTLTELARRSSLSRPTVASQLAELGAEGWIDELSPVLSGGRPARRFRFNSRAGHVVGIDVGAHSARAAVADLHGEILGAERTDLRQDQSPDDRLRAAADLVTDVLAAADVERQSVLAVTVGTVGVVSADGRITHSILPGWAGLDVASALHESLTCPVLVENDANLAAVAEIWRGAAQGFADVAYVMAGRRNGAALILDGRLRRGFFGAAGEIGALDVLGWDSGPALLAQAAGPLADDSDAAERVFAAAQAGNPGAQRAVDEFTSALAQGIAALVLTIDPEAVVVGGGVSVAHEALVNPLRGKIEALCLTAPQVRGSTLGRDAVLLGAVRLSLDHVNTELLGLERTAGWDAPRATSSPSAPALSR